MTPAFASESLAMRMFAPGGIVTRTGAPVPLPHDASTHAAASTRDAPRADPTIERGLSAVRGLAGTTQRMLKKHRRREGVDVTLAASRRAAHLAHGAQRGRRRVALI